MPELPEVETVRRTLVELIVGKTIKSVEVLWPKMIKKPDDSTLFKHLLVGQTIQSIERRGKFLKFILDDFVLVSHLRMEGRYSVCPEKDNIDKHTHVRFMFTDHSELRYRDVRKFGTMHLFEKGLEEESLPLSQLGPEPFSKDFTLSYLEGKLWKTDRKIKVALLDQTIVTGLGNIYVDEALFRAGVHPERISRSLSKSEIARIHHQVIQTLTEAVEKGGSTIRSYVNSMGQIGMFQLTLFVYGRNGKECKKCGHIISKSKVGGRGTHYCINCQH